MFTGIVEEIGIIKRIENKAQGAVISVGCKQIFEDLNIGDSVAINGACQTVIKLENGIFDVEASPETLNLTTLKYFKEGAKVNLERAMSANGRFGGHIVSGHIDGVGEFREKQNQGLADMYYFSVPDEVAKYIVYKGSICIDGISLTIASLQDNIFNVSVISHTAQSTILGDLKSGDKVNLESDIIAKYVEKFMPKSDNASGNNISMNYLEEHGFI
jgi:riboflavin synthase